MIVKDDSEEKDAELMQAYLSRSFSVRKSGKDEDYDVFKKSASDIKKLRGLDKNYIRRSDRRLSKAYENSAGTVRSKQINVDEMMGYNYLDCMTPEYNLDYLARLYEVSPAHHAAVNAKVESVFGLGYDWIETAATKNARQRIRTESGLKSLEKSIQDAKLNITLWLENINKEDVFEKTMKKVGIDYEVMGNAYIEIGRDLNGRIAYIGHVPAKHVRVRRDRDGFVQIFGNRVTFFRNFGENKPNTVTNDPNPNELIHLKKYSPNDNYYGIPDIISAQNALAGNEMASRYNLDYFENKAVPRHAIVTKGATLSQPAMNTLVEFFETGLRGQHHRSVYVPLGDSDAEIEFHAIEAGKQDSSFGDYRASNNEEIFMAHRIPPTRAGVFGNINVAASKDADKVFKESYSRPEQAIFEKIIKRVFLEMTDIIEFKLNELSLIDEDVQAQIDERNLRSGVAVPDEVRARRGMPARPDGKGNEPMALSAQQQADQKATALQSRARDTERSNNTSDSAASKTGRNPKGEGRKTA